MKIQKVVLTLVALVVSSSLLAMQPQIGYGVLAEVLKKGKPPAKPIAKEETRSLPAAPVPSQAPVEQVKPAAALVSASSLPITTPVEDAEMKLFLEVFGCKHVTSYIGILGVLASHPQVNVNAHWERDDLSGGELGKTPLMLLIKRGRDPYEDSDFRQEFNVLIKSGANINARNSRNGKTILHYVSELSHHHEVHNFHLCNLWDFLVEHGANPNIPDNADQLPERPGY